MNRARQPFEVVPPPPNEVRAPGRAEDCCTVRFGLLLLGLMAVLSACGRNNPGPVTPAPGSAEPSPSLALAPLPAPAHTWTGHYVGMVKIAGTVYLGDGVVTDDGALRLYVGGPYDDGGELQATRPDSSEQLVGKIEVLDGQWSGSGVVIGQQCAANASRFCGQTASAQLNGTLAVDTNGSGKENIRGEIQVRVAGAAETWTVDLLLWPDVGMDGGQFKEMLAEFADADNVIVVIDGSGTFFFQSAGSGCIGNGVLSIGPGAYIATLLIESCNGAYAYLNGSYEGLASGTAGSIWDYDSMPHFWLSKPSGVASPAALTMLGQLP